jgi:hypothetical protein
VCIEFETKAINRQFKQSAMSQLPGVRRQAELGIYNFLTVAVHELGVRLPGVPYPFEAHDPEPLLTVFHVPLFAHDFDDGRDVREIMKIRLLFQVAREATSQHDLDEYYTKACLT